MVDGHDEEGEKERRKSGRKEWWMNGCIEGWRDGGMEDGSKERFWIHERRGGGRGGRSVVESVNLGIAAVKHLIQQFIEQKKVAPDALLGQYPEIVLVEC